MKAGQPILELDLDYLNANARSMISPVVVSNADDYADLAALPAARWSPVRPSCTRSKRPFYLEGSIRGRSRIMAEFAPTWREERSLPAFIPFRPMAVRCRADGATRRIFRETNGCFQTWLVGS